MSENVEDNPFELMENRENERENSILFDTLLIEADRIATLRYKDLDLFYQDPTTGEFRKVGEAYRHSISSFKDKIFHKKRTRYFITFIDTVEMEDGLKPTSLKIIRHFARVMSYGNTIKGYGLRDIMSHFKIHERYITSGMNQLFEKDLVRFEVIKGRRTYMVNPIYYFKGTPTGLFMSVKTFRGYPTWEDHIKAKAEKKRLKAEMIEKSWFK
jgi:hypothetical protein